jgi:A118 family predicted phage portal protein
LSVKAGLGNNFYKIDGSSGSMTATEVVSKNSDTWRNRKKHVKVLREVLIGMMKGILALDKSVNGYTGDPEAIEYDVKFDDSIIVDDNKRIEEMKMDATDGFIAKWRYVAEKYQITEEEAKEWIAEAQKDESEGSSDFFNQMLKEEPEEDEPEVEEDDEETEE